MKTKFWAGIILLAVTAAQAQTNNLTALLQQGLFAEQADHNLDAAIADYQALATQFDKDRQLAATAVFRLGECYRAQGRTNEAAAQYEHILHDFSDQKTLATLSQQNLKGMGVVLGERLNAVIAREPLGITLLQARIPNPEQTRELEMVKRLEAMRPDEIRQTAPTLLTDGALINLINQYNQSELDLLRLRTDHGEEHPEVKKTMVIQQELEQKIKERLAGLDHALTLDLAVTAPVSPGAAPAISSEEDQEIQHVREMIQNSPDLINAPAQGSTPLVKAAYNGWMKVAAYLLDHGADVNVWCARIPDRKAELTDLSTDGDHVTPLQAAVTAGNKAMTELLLDRGANINPKEPNTLTPLHVAAGKGFQAVAEILIGRQADVNARNSAGATPLFLAATSGQLKIVQMLLAAGANPNVQDKRGWTALNYGIGAGSTEIVKTLLATGMDANTEDEFKRTPLSYTVERGDVRLVGLFLDAKADPNAGKKDAPIFEAIKTGGTNTLRLLLAAGANPDQAGEVTWVLQDKGYVANGGTLSPLRLAIMQGKPEMVRLLLQYKANPDGTDQWRDGQPYLFVVLENPEILQMMLETGARVDIRENAARNGNIERHWTPLHWAAAVGNAAAVEILLKHGADPDARDGYGNTALQSALEPGRDANRKVVELLLEHHADPNARNDYGATPLSYAKKADNGTGNGGAIAGLLREHGALDRLPDWDRIAVGRASANFLSEVFHRNTNDWNQFTLLEAILNYYAPPNSGLLNYNWNASPDGSTMAFPDLAHVTIVRPSHGSTNETRIVINILNSTNGIDCSRDVPLEFGDVVEIPERDHALGDNSVGLDNFQRSCLFAGLNGHIQLIVGDQKVRMEIAPEPAWALIGAALAKDEARRILLSSSDLSRVKITRHDPKTGKKQEWVLDCTGRPSSSSRTVNTIGTPGVVNVTGTRGFFINGLNGSPSGPDFWLRDGDVIEVPEKQ